MKRIEFIIYRGDGEERGRFQKFLVPFEEGMSVLDGVRHIEQNLDTTLGVRWNCKAARCGSCSAEINGKPSLMCKTRAEGLGKSIMITPMRAYPHVRDLVSDPTENFEISRRIPAFRPKGEKTPWKFYEADVERSQEFRRCIECFLCQDVCHVVREHKSGYVGPRHVIEAAALDMHPMDTLKRHIYLNKEGGLGFCNITKCCQDVCPEHIRITDNAIIPEKERSADAFYDPLAYIVKRLRDRGDK